MSAAPWPLYGAAGRLAAPLAALYLTRRAARGREDTARTAEKRGVASHAPFDAPPVWLHAVSVGEAVAGLALAERLVPSSPVLLTTATPGAAARVAPRLSPRLVHQYAPLDAPPFVERFLAHWRPRAAVFVEAEVWPTTLFALARLGVPRAHVNARLSDRSYARWRRGLRLAKPLFGTIDLALAPSGMQALRFASLGAREAVVTGNLKFDAEPPPADAHAVAELVRAVGDRPVWLAASTHPGEEEVVLKAQRRIAAVRPDVLTLIAPRHPERGAAVAELAAAAGRVTRRSRGEPPDGTIHVIDTLGELGTLYSACDVVFLGGSLVPCGGHNPGEPAAYDAAILTGPSHGSMLAPFLDRGAARVVADASGLAAAVLELLDDRGARAAMGAAARRTLEAERGAVERTMARLGPWLDGAG
ncbi:3-deoxy-D-manno-octulosonic acid transferase [Acuticoccus sp.]|uniref:3-deoxy-D-manno-octulosonic acid transferase n=1 Tax=Acuticoccus sp. TaxID=1904378 RepID=UPI003B51D422